MIDFSSVEYVQNAGRSLSVDGPSVRQRARDDEVLSGDAMTVEWMLQQPFYDPL
jgi:hypothetical protein